MAIHIDIRDACFLPAEYSYVDTRPADWWKGNETIEYDIPAHFESQGEPQSTAEKEFLRLSKKWKSETSGFSSVASMVMHPAYLEVISHGEEMIPFILKDLEQKPSHWFIALKTLAKNFSPVKQEDAGNIKKMTSAWLTWGRENGYIS